MRIAGGGRRHTKTGYVGGGGTERAGVKQVLALLAHPTCRRPYSSGSGTAGVRRELKRSSNTAGEKCGVTQ